MDLPERDGPVIATREPAPNGACASIAASNWSLVSSARRCVGQSTSMSSMRAPCTTSSAATPLIVSTRISDGWRSERRGERTGPEILSPATSSQRRA